ncbi:NTP transferase domain-containing protein [Candidatus Bathyarchaeota archaeon]|nr:NTP transferase domain-containing protein [Candidatus Bathyarchaeota archaeon]
MKSVILAAGEGKRLLPLTSTRPKHLLKIAGKPLLEHCLDAVKASGINEVTIVVHYMGDAIRRHFGNGEKLGLKIDYVEQKAVLGTGNAVSVVEPYMKEEFLLVYGDVLFTAEAVKTVIAAYEAEKPTIAMAVVPVEHTESYGIVELAEDEKNVKGIVEKPKNSEAPSNLANAGVYIFSPEIFAKIKEISSSPRGEIEITDAISRILGEHKKIIAAKLSRENWLEIGKPWDLLEANRWMLDRMKHKIRGTVENGAHIIGEVTVAETARIRSGAYIEGPALIGEECDIGPNCYIRPYTTINSKVRIGNACEVKESIIMDKAHVGHLSYIGDSIIGENCNLGAGTITGNFRLDGGSVKMVVKDALVDSGRRKLGAVLGDNVKTGIGALLMPGVKVGCNSWIGPGVVVYRDVSSDVKVMLKQSLEEEKLAK